jgi:hypothetical protein
VVEPANAEDLQRGLVWAGANRAKLEAMRSKALDAARTHQWSSYHARLRELLHSEAR